MTRWIFVATLAVFLLTSGRERPWGDGNVQYMVAQSLLSHQGLDVRVPWPEDLPPGRGGKHYSTWPILTSLLQVPGLALLEGLEEVSPKVRPFAEPLTTHLAPSLFGALGCVMFFRLCRRHGVSARGASVATAILAFGTTIWVYAHYSYSEIYQTCFLLGFLGSVEDALADPAPRAGRRLGLWAGLLFSMKYIYAVSILGACVYLAWCHRRSWRKLARALAWAAAVGAPFLVLTALYNYACWGSFTQTGYHPYFESYWGENVLVGLWGMFLSPGKSVFLYSPPLIFACLGLPLVWRKRRRLAIAALATVVPVLLVYSRYKLNGDYAWGPRFVVFAVPVLLLPLAFFLDEKILPLARRWRWGFLGAVLVPAVFVQVLGLSFYWDHFIRISMDVKQQWLGRPNRKGAIIPVRANGQCDSCFEDVHQLEWLPPFQPILGHLWLARSQLAGDDATRAQRIAPWRRHTHLDFNIKENYGRVRFDWWGMLFLRDHPRYAAYGWVLLSLMLAGTALGATMWARQHRREAKGS